MMKSPPVEVSLKGEDLLSSPKHLQVNGDGGDGREEEEDDEAAEEEEGGRRVGLVGGE